MFRERLAVAGGALCGFAAWCGGRLTLALWRPLRALTFDAVAEILVRVYPQSVADAAEKTISTGIFAVRIDDACSGYEGIGLVLVFVATALWVFRADLRFPRALLLLPIAVVTIWCANVVRIAALIAIGTSISQGVALGGFHSQAGWLLVVAVTLGLLTVALNARLFSRRASGAVDLTEESPSLAYVLPLLTLVFTMMVTGAATAEVDWLYPIRVATTGLMLWRFRRVYSHFDWSWSWRAALAGLGAFVLWILLDPELTRGPTEMSNGLGSMNPATAGVWLACRCVGAILVVPLAEELALRGYLMRRFSAHEFTEVRYQNVSWLAIAASSVIFGLMHDRWAAGVAAGFCYAWVVRTRGNLADAVIAHATTNLLIAAMAGFGGYWSLWS